MNETASEKRSVAIGSLPLKTQKRLAEQIADPAQREQIVEYIGKQELKAAAVRKKKRRTSKLARKRNRTR